MNKDIQNGPNPGDEEVDLIRLFNYFKNGVKSFFRRIGSLFGYIFQLIILLKRNWIMVVGLTACGALYSLFLRPQFENKKAKSYKMIVQSNPVSNFELYALADEINKQFSLSSDENSDGVLFAKSLGITSMKITPVEREEDVVNDYFNQIQSASFRGDQSDTLYFKSFEIRNHKSKMEKPDYIFQEISIKTDKGVASKEIQTKLLGYINKAPGVVLEKESRMATLTNYEYQLKRTVTNIDSLLVSKAFAEKKMGPTGSEQLLVNTASRGTVEGDLLRYSEVFTRKLYSTQKMIAAYKNGVSVVSDLRSIKENEFISNAVLRYSFFGFILATLIVLLLQFNKFLKRYEQKHNI